MSEQFPKDYEALEAVRMYLTRDCATAYPLNVASRWVGSTITDLEPPAKKWYYEGTFADCLVQFMRDGHYFNGWIMDRCMAQVDNQNNGTLDEFIPPQDPKFKHVKLGFGNRK